MMEDSWPRGKIKVFTLRLLLLLDQTNLGELGQASLPKS